MFPGSVTYQLQQNKGEKEFHLVQGPKVSFTRQYVGTGSGLGASGGMLQMEHDIHGENLVTHLEEHVSRKDIRKTS